MEIESCGARRLFGLHSRVNQLVRSIWSLLDDATGRRHFAAGEREWRLYRADECAARSGAYVSSASPHQYVGGSGAPVRFSDCEQEVTVAHLAALASTAAELGVH